MKSYPVCGLDHDWTHRSTLNKENYSNTNQIRNSSGLSSQFCYMIRCIIFRWGNFEVEKFDPAVDFGVFETGRVKISSSICSLCFFFWGSMKKYIHIHIWFIWYCNWICNTQVLYTYIYQESSAIKCRWEYLIHREKHIPYEYIINWICSTRTRRPTGCVQTTRNVGGFISKKGVRHAKRSEVRCHSEPPENRCRVFGERQGRCIEERGFPFFFFEK